jgi:hypothetical protein
MRYKGVRMAGVFVISRHIGGKAMLVKVALLFVNQND